MEFSNQTGCPAQFQVGSTGEVEMVGMAACKATWRVDRGRLVPAGESECWPLFEKPHEMGGITFQPELDFRKQGTDLLVLGTIRAPQERPVTQLEVGLQCGRVALRTTVFGDRRWEKSWSKLKASEPQKFIKLPLSNELAFGGVGHFEGQPLLHTVNPHGRGFYITKEDAEGKPLPNLERPGQLIRGWEDRPVPACWHKPQGPMELAGGGDPEALPAQIGKSFFNQAVPELVAPLEHLGDRVQLSGFAAEGPLDMPMPPLSGPYGEVRVGDLHSRIPARLSTVVLLADSRAVVATYVCLFRYLMRPRELRTMELIWPGGGHA